MLLLYSFGCTPVQARPGQAMGNTRMHRRKETDETETHWCSGGLDRPSSALSLVFSWAAWLSIMAGSGWPPPWKAERYGTRGYGSQVRRELTRELAKVAQWHTRCSSMTSSSRHNSSSTARREQQQHVQLLAPAASLDDSRRNSCTQQHQQHSLQLPPVCLPGPGRRDSGRSPLWQRGRCSKRRRTWRRRTSIVHMCILGVSCFPHGQA